MNISLKHFCLGMLLGLLPATIIVKTSLNESNARVLSSYAQKYQEKKLKGENLPQIEPEVVEAKTVTAVASIDADASKNEPTKAILRPVNTNVPVNTPKPVQTAPQMAADSSGDAVSMIDRYAAEYGVDAAMMKQIAKCESGFRAEAVNGPYGGMYQFLASTWSSNRNAMGENPDPALRFDAEEAVKTAAFKMSRDGYGAWPSCSRI